MKAFEYEPQYQKTTLKSGVRVITENHPYSRSVCAGITVNLGSRDEPAALEGAAHFVEHMVFKGTQKRSAYEISRDFEVVGGELNAYTSKEQTCFHGSVLKEDLPIAVDVLSDLMGNATMSASDLETERQVILQEIDMSNDELDEVSFEECVAGGFSGHSIGKPILGTKSSLQAISRDQLNDFYRSRYHGKNMIVSVAGHVDHEEVCDLVNQSLSLKSNPPEVPERTKPQWQSYAKSIKRDSEQVHVTLGLPSCSYSDPLRFAGFVLNAAFGGGMTSRLYQKIREQEGLCYSVYSMHQPFEDQGVFNVYAGTSQEYLKKLCEILKAEFQDLLSKGLSQKELEQFKQQSVGELIMEADDVENRMNALALHESIFGNYRPLDEIIQDLQAVDLNSVNQYIKTHFDLSKLSLVVVGDTNEGQAQELLNFIRG